MDIQDAINELDKLEESERGYYKQEKPFGVIYEGTRSYNMDKFFATPEEALNTFLAPVIYGSCKELGYIISGNFWHAYEGFEAFATVYNLSAVHKEYDEGYKFVLNGIGWLDPIAQSWEEVEAIVKDFNNKNIALAKTEYISWANNRD